MNDMIAGDIFQNTLNKKLYYCYGVFPHYNQKEEDTIILSEVFNGRVLTYLKKSEFTRQVKVEEEMKPRFVKITLDNINVVGIKIKKPIIFKR